MSVCLLRQDGEVVRHRPMPARPDALRQAMAPSRDERVLAVACLCPWSWRADLWAQEGRPLVLGHALSLQALHGGQAHNDTIDSPNIAVRLRGGLRPQASVSPAEMRATRDLLRRRMPRMRTRAARLAPLHKTNRPDPRPEIGTKRADKRHRDGVAARGLAPAVPPSVEVDLALIDHAARRRSALDLTIVQTAPQHQAHALSRRHAVPGLGKRGRLVLLSAMHDLTRFPRGQDGVSSCRLVTCATASAGPRDGTSGHKRGHASRTWAFAEAAVRLRRHHAPSQKVLARLANTHGKGTALTIVAHQVARAVSYRVTRATVWEMDRGLNGYGSSAGAPAASRDTQGSRLHDRPWHSPPGWRHGTHQRTEAFGSEPSRWLGHPRWLLRQTGMVGQG
jgi:hypothetical protein